MGGTQVKENKCKCAQKGTHIAILLMSVLEGGLHYASEGPALDKIAAPTFEVLWQEL